MDYLVARYSCTKRRYQAIGGRFETYGDAEAYGAALHSQSVDPQNLRFIPMSAETYRRTVAAVD